MGGQSTATIRDRRIASYQRRHYPWLGAPLLLFGLLGIALRLSGAVAPATPGRAPGMAATPQLLLTAPPASGSALAPDSIIRPIDPLTLADLPGYTPLAIGTNRWSVANPNGTMVALLGDAATAIVAAPGAARQARLQLLDVTGWRIRETPIIVGGEIGWFGFARDGQTLAWLSFDGSSEIAAHQRAYTLYRYRLGESKAEALATLPPGFADDSFRQSRSGRELIGYRIEAGQITPQLDFFDLDSGRNIATLKLTDIRATPPKAATINHLDDERYVPGIAWDLPRDRLYIAHAEAALITVVDLDKRAVERRGTRGEEDQQFTVGERYRDGSGPPPIARTARYQFLALDSTGGRLIVSGRTITATPLVGGRWREEDRYTAMRVLDVRNLRTLGELPLDSMLVAATGDSVLTQSVRFLPGGASIAPGDFRLRLWDPTGQHEVWYRDTAPGDIWGQFSAPDDRFIYLMRPNAAQLFREGEDQASGPGNTFVVFDLRTRQLLAERRVSGGSLIPLWHTR